MTPCAPTPDGSGPDELPPPAADPGPSTSGSPTSTGTGGASPAHSDWSALDDTARRRRLDAMDPDAVRSMAASMPVIEQAKGVLMTCFGLDAGAAFALLRRVSSVRNLPLRVVAVLVVDAVRSTAGTAPDPAVSPVERVRRALRETFPPLRRGGPRDLPSTAGGMP